jgi:hypothetical protein
LLEREQIINIIAGKAENFSTLSMNMKNIVIYNLK